MNDLANESVNRSQNPLGIDFNTPALQRKRRLRALKDRMARYEAMITLPQERPAFEGFKASAERYLALMRHDKKVSAGVMRLVVVDGVHVLRAVTDLPWLPEGFVEEVERTIALPTIEQMRVLDAPFVGLLYCGLILTERGIRVIEFNARFGDPETQVVLRRLTSSLSNLLYKASTGQLNGEITPDFSRDVAITVVLASEGYPDTSAPNRPISGLAEAEETGIEICHAATAAGIDDTGEEVLIATGGRVLSVVATGLDFNAARAQAYAGIEKIQLEGSHYRKDNAARVAN
mgnify:CR=1 FL=1